MYSLSNFWRHLCLSRAAAHGGCCFFAPCTNILTYLLTRPAVGSEASTSVAHAGHVARRLITTRIRGFAFMRYINPWLILILKMSPEFAVFPHTCPKMWNTVVHCRVKYWCHNVSAIWNRYYRIISNDNSQGGVAMHLKCDGIFTDKFVSK